MTYQFTRQELYGLVWSEPMRLLAKRYEISGRGLAKACEKANIPVPERGYWNKLQAGKKVVREALPPRGFGMADEVTIGYRDRYSWNMPSDKELLDMELPPPPVFETPVDEVRAQVTKLVNGVAFPKTMKRPLRLIDKLLKADEARLQKKLSSPYSYSWDDPIFDTSFERRRLKILNALFSGLEEAGMKPSLSGKQERDPMVTVGDSDVPFVLDGVNAGKKLERERAGYQFEARGNAEPMQLALTSWARTRSDPPSWQDSEQNKIEDFLNDIAIEIIVTGEQDYRNGQVRRHNYMIERKAKAVEAERQRIIDAENKRIERQRQIEQANLDHLLGQARAFQQAAEIRAFVADVRAKVSVTDKNIEEWAAWALQQADRLDPVTSGKFVPYRDQEILEPPPGQPDKVK